MRVFKAVEKSINVVEKPKCEVLYGVLCLHWYFYVAYMLEIIWFQVAGPYWDSCSCLEWCDLIDMYRVCCIYDLKWKTFVNLFCLISWFNVIKSCNHFGCTQCNWFMLSNIERLDDADKPLKKEIFKILYYFISILF